MGNLDITKNAKQNKNITQKTKKMGSMNTQKN